MAAKLRVCSLADARRRRNAQSDQMSSVHEAERRTRPGEKKRARAGAENNRVHLARLHMPAVVREDDKPFEAWRNIGQYAARQERNEQIDAGVEKDDRPPTVFEPSATRSLARVDSHRAEIVGRPKNDRQEKQIERDRHRAQRNVDGSLNCCKRPIARADRRATFAHLGDAIDRGRRSDQGEVCRWPPTRSTSLSPSCGSL